jgi:hypothetical protein
VVQLAESPRVVMPKVWHLLERHTQTEAEEPMTQLDPPQKPGGSSGRDAQAADSGIAPSGRGAVSAAR